MPTLEIAANIFATLSIFLAGRNSLHTWWTGIIGCALFAALFHGARLYADVTLQAFFIVTSLVGWRLWLRGPGGAARTVTRAPSRTLALAALVAALAALGYGAMLHTLTDAYAPFADSAVLAFSVLAQWLLMQRRLQTWPFWLLVNTIAVPLYASRGLWLTAALYAAYWVNAVLGWRRWAAEIGDPSTSPRPEPA